MAMNLIKYVIAKVSHPSAKGVRCECARQNKSQFSCRGTLRVMITQKSFVGRKSILPRLKVLAKKGKNFKKNLLEHETAIYFLVS